MARNRGKNIRLFKSDFLEKQTHVDPIVPALLWVPIVSYFLWRSVAVHGFGFSGMLSMAILGILVWTLTEYCLHRYVFHFKPRNAIEERLVFLFHGIHHDDPNDATRLVMPPLPGILIASVFYLLFRLLLGPVWVEPFFAFFLIGYLCYDYIHYYTHHFKPKTAIGKYIKQNHMDHHFRHHEALWGVSSPLWDFVFGTYVSRKSPKPQYKNLSPE